MPEDFTGPGVDLRGEDAERAIAAAGPIERWLAEREPGIVLRSLSVDRARLRVLVTLEQENDRPRVLRFDPPHANELIDAGAEAERVITEAAERKISARA